MDVESGFSEDNVQGSTRLKSNNSSWQLYKAATEDDRNKLVDLLNRVSAEKGVSQPAILCQVRSQGNTMLHLAVRFGRETNVTLLLECNPSLLRMRNWKGDTALHVAARYGRQEIAVVLIDFERHISGRGNFVSKYSRGYLLERLANEAEISREHLLKMLKNQAIKRSFDTLLLEEDIEEEEISAEESLAMPYKPISEIYSFEPEWRSVENTRKLQDLVVKLQNESKEPLAMLRNANGDTALHEAFISRQERVVSILIGLTSEVWFLLNKEKKSPLYLAVEAGYEASVEVMLRDPVEIENFKKWQKGLSPVRAAILARNEDILRKLLEKEPRLVDLRHEEEEPYSRVGEVGSALHLAASCGYVKVVDVLLAFDPFSATERDISGSFPIHVASRTGHVDVIAKLLPYCLDLIAMTENQGRNILHIAAESGKYDVLRYILKQREHQILVNQMDGEGNTPLHLASMHWHPKIVNALARYDGTDLNAINKEGLTALGIIERSMDLMPSFRKLLTWGALKAGCASPIQPNKIGQYSKHDGSNNETKMKRYKDRVNTLLLVATLVATVTFAAGFTMPGGYNNSAPDQGMATMLRSFKLQAFVLCDTIAMYSSIIVAVTLIWAQLGDFNLAANALRLAVPLMGISLTTMSLAFMAGIYLVVGKLSWLAITVLVVGLIFQVLQALLFLPLWLPVSWSNHHFFSYIFRYLFWLLLVTGCVTDDTDNAAAPSYTVMTSR